MQASEVTFTPLFEIQRKKAPLEIKEAFLDTFELFLEDPHHPLLRNHPLKEKFTGFRSINITEDWRAVFKESKSRKRKIITFYLLGTHKELYK